MRGDGIFHLEWRFHKVDKKADYVLALKGNQGLLREDVELFVAEQKASPFPFAFFHPMCGGMPVELAWSSLRLFETQVLPAFA